MKPNLKMLPVCLAFAVAIFSVACSKSNNPPAATSEAQPTRPPASAGQPATAGQAAKQAGGEAGLWKSETTGKEFRVTTKGDTFVADWVDLPSVAAARGAFIHDECKRQGSKWVGFSEVFLPCTAGQGANERVVNTCHLKVKLELDSVTRDLITGRGQSLKKFDCQSCKVVETGWGNFKWTPVK